MNNKKDMKNLTIEHLAPYLPYELKIKTNNIIRLMVAENNTVDVRFKTTIRNVIKGIGHKPILRPLSNLTKEIDHNGEKFVPRDNLPMYAAYDREIQRAILMNKDILKLCYIDIQKLFEWHFDVFNLIENNLAIKKDDI